jgi:PIN domain nuclease of toxin-antitoxin system
VRLLVDTAAFLWFVSGDNRLPVSTREIIRSSGNAVWLSVVSLWEAAVKQQIGRLELPAPAWAYITRQRERHGIDTLPLEETAIAHLAKLPAIHRDPFDRMLICQAIQHDSVLVTDDELVCRYPVKTIWLP